MKRAICLGPIALAAAILLSGCNGSSPAAAAEPASGVGSTIAVPPSEPTPAEQLAQLEKEGKLPKLDRSASVAGPDTDGNGVRDDIDVYLKQRFSKDSQHAAAVQMAKAMQSAVLVEASNRDASQSASNGLSNAIHCLFIRFDPTMIGVDNPAAVTDEIEAITTNTKARLLAYLAYNKSRDGTTSTSPDGDSCE